MECTCGRPGDDGRPCEVSQKFLATPFTFRPLIRILSLAQHIVRLLQSYSTPPRNLYSSVYKTERLLEQYLPRAMYVPVLITGLNSDSSIKPPPLRRLAGRIQTQRKRPGSRPSQSQTATNQGDGGSCPTARICKYCGRYAINNHNAATCPKRKRDARGNGNSDEGGLEGQLVRFSDEDNERVAGLSGDGSSNPVEAYFKHRHAADQLASDEDQSENLELDSDSIKGIGSSNDDRESNEQGNSRGESGTGKGSNSVSSTNSAVSAVGQFIQEVMQNETRRQITRLANAAATPRATENPSKRRKRVSSQSKHPDSLSRKRVSKYSVSLLKQLWPEQGIRE